jgi:hypothetical protein
VLLAASTSGAGAQSAFRALEGSWSGGGRIVLEGGASERLSCRANYGARSAGNGLGLAIRCASSSYRIELRASLVNSGGSVSGTWDERTFNASGTVSGRASASALNLVFWGNVSGGMSVNVGPRRQRVSITGDSGFQSVAINLTRS